MGSLKPFFPFYGSKWRDARKYPAPGDTLFEPFAGSAGYATWFSPRNVFLSDADPIIVGVWSYLIGVSGAEILALPDLEPGESVDTLTIPQEARWLIGFWLNRGSSQPKKTRTAFSSRTDRSQLVWSERARVRIASQVDAIRHWRVEQRSYDSLEPTVGTWFVDPPYVDKGRYYRFKNVDYTKLGEWCGTLRDQVIVCEQAGASWLPFAPLATIKSTKGTSEEVVFVRDAR